MCPNQWVSQLDHGAEPTSLKAIHDGITRFQEQEFPRRRKHFEKLAGGQSPQLLLVTCSDSRIDPGLLTQTAPGEVFVVRNAGNLVPPAASGPGGEAATIEYGLEALGIEHIAVCGHTHCGAMAALRDPSLGEGLETVPAWLEHARPALQRDVRVGDGADPLTNTVGANVLAQLDHLRTWPFVRRRLENSQLTLHGWVYDFETAAVHVADSAGVFRPLSDAIEQEVA